MSKGFKAYIKKVSNGGIIELTHENGYKEEFVFQENHDEDADRENIADFLRSLVDHLFPYNKYDKKNIHVIDNWPGHKIDGKDDYIDWFCKYNCIGAETAKKIRKLIEDSDDYSV